MTQPTTPADELRTAATRLRKLATAARSEDWGDRPWQAEECDEKEEGSCACIVSQGEYRDFDQPQIPPVQYVADAELTVYAAYIATMHPGVGAALAVLLENFAAGDHKPHASGTNDCLMRCQRAHPGQLICNHDDRAWPCPDVQAALAVARLINTPA